MIDYTSKRTDSVLQGATPVDLHQRPPARDIVFHETSPHREIFRIKPLQDGAYDVALGPDVTWTHAAKAFWNAVFKLGARPEPFPEVRRATSPKGEMEANRARPRRAKA